MTHPLAPSAKDRAATLGRLQMGLVGAIAGTCLISIFAAQFLLALAVAVFLLRLARRDVPFPRLCLDGPIAAFSVWTLLSAAFSADPAASIEDAKKIVLFLLLYVAVSSSSSSEGRERLVDGLLLGGLVLAAGALMQYEFQGFDTLGRRPRSFLGHYMTASGLAMGVLVLAVSRLALQGQKIARPGREDMWALGLLVAALAGLHAFQVTDLFALEAERLFVGGLTAAAGALAVARGRWPTRATSQWLTLGTAAFSAAALLVSQTRSAWLGALGGLAVVGLRRAPRSLWLIPVLLTAAIAVKPHMVLDRLTLQDASSLDRYYLWQAGIDMILDKPIFGQGPGMILRVYPDYRWPDAPNPQTPHLHANALQLAAERGLPCLIWWLWLMFGAFVTAYQAARPRRPSVWTAGAALAVLTAVTIAGMFEYNFGDSEVLMFTLLVLALPFGLQAEQELGQAAQSPEPV